MGAKRLSIENIQNDVEKMLAQKAIEIQEELTDAAERAMSEFYDDYVPSFYSRTYSLYGAYDSYINKINNKHYQVVIEFYPSAVVTNHDSSEYVYQGIMNQGIHGTTKIWNPMSPTPAELFHEVFNKYL